MTSLCQLQLDEPDERARAASQPQPASTCDHCTSLNGRLEALLAMPVQTGHAGEKLWMHANSYASTAVREDSEDV